MNRRELFDKAVEAVTRDTNWVVHKTVDHPDYVFVIFKSKREEYGYNELKAIREHIAKKGWKSILKHNDGSFLSRARTSVVKEYYAVYRKQKDSVSCGFKHKGILYSENKNRYYPVGKSTPAMAFTSKGMWGFNGGKPRVLKGNTDSIWRQGDEFSRVFGKVFMNTGVEWVGLNVTWKILQDTKDRYELLKKLYGIMVPENLRMLDDRVLTTLCQVIKPEDIQVVSELFEKLKREEQPTRKSRATLYDLEKILQSVLKAAEGQQQIISEWIEDTAGSGQKLELNEEAFNHVRELRMGRERYFSHAIKRRPLKFEDASDNEPEKGSLWIRTILYHTPEGQVKQLTQELKYLGRKNIVSHSGEELCVYCFGVTPGQNVHPLWSEVIVRERDFPVANNPNPSGDETWSVITYKPL